MSLFPCVMVFGLDKIFFFLRNARQPFLLNIVVSPGNGRKSHKMPQQQENVGLPASAQAKGKI